MVIVVAALACHGCGGGGDSDERALSSDPAQALKAALATPVKRADVTLDLRITVKAGAAPRTTTLRLAGPYERADARRLARFAWRYRLTDDSAPAPSPGTVTSTGDAVAVASGGQRWLVDRGAIERLALRLRRSPARTTLPGFAGIGTQSAFEDVRELAAQDGARRIEGRLASPTLFETANATLGPTGAGFSAQEERALTEALRQARYVFTLADDGAVRSVEAAERIATPPSGDRRLGSLTTIATRLSARYEPRDAPPDVSVPSGAAEPLATLPPALEPVVPAQLRDLSPPLVERSLGSPKAYPASVVQAFVASCAARAGSDASPAAARRRCACVLDEIRGRVTYERFLRAEDRVLRGADATLGVDSSTCADA